MEKPDRLTPASQVKKGPPSLSDWQDFFSRFVIKILVDIYLNIVLGDLVMELSPTERDMIKLSAKDMSDIAAPLAVMTEKTSFGKKHGRSIIAMADSYESVITLLFWMRRVNRVARKHKPAKQRKQRPAAQGVVIPPKETNNAFTDGYNQRDSDGSGINGYEYPVFNPGAG